MGFYETEKLETSNPVELFAIHINGLWLYLTSFNEEISHGNNVYKPVQIKRSSIEVDSNDVDNELEIQLPIKSISARNILNSVYESVAEVVVYRGHKDLNDFLVLYTGMIIKKEIDKTYLKLVAMPTNYALERNGNRARYTRTCRHVLYESGCNLNRADHHTKASVIGQGSNALKLNVSLSKDYEGGFVDVVNVGKRMILSVNGDTIGITNGFNGSVKGKPCIVYKGCDKTTKCCRERFNNLANHGGYPFIPLKNIFNGSIQ